MEQRINKEMSQRTNNEAETANPKPATIHHNRRDVRKTQLPLPSRRRHSLPPMLRFYRLGEGHAGTTPLRRRTATFCHCGRSVERVVSRRPDGGVCPASENRRYQKSPEKV